LVVSANYEHYTLSGGGGGSGNCAVKLKKIKIKKILRM
jgi:hypothetical protein